MKIIFNHSAHDLPEALQLSETVRTEVLEICTAYVSELSITSILDRIQTLYGSSAVVFASFIIGQLVAINSNNLFNLNLLKCQREN